MNRASCVFVALLFTAACGGAAEPEALEEGQDALIGDSPEAVLRANVGLAAYGTDPRTGDRCVARVVASGSSYLLQHSFDETRTPEGLYNGVGPRSLRSEWFSRALVHERSFGNTFPYPCQFSGDNGCQVERIVVEYNADRRITRITESLNGAVRGVCELPR